ncbi:hypothetical protein LTR62_004325 [Meristemomyces frigidus]|uniref:Carboxylesterase type B domain-containing protein n=1 Tax=Meristemomyces frigidus TaxID=1508187 RepID=A0AAN7YGB4_9PEZI|nr:hypothetical protein LTR62_004325 [Meristemomyces frigidus]
MSKALYTHPILGKLKGHLVNDTLLRLSSIPYGSIPQRFGRSTVRTEALFPLDNGVYDARGTILASIQPIDAATIDCKGNQFPLDSVQNFEEAQSEDCLRLNIALPASTTPASSLPVLIFIHGGAFFLGSGGRPYYDPTHFCLQALRGERPHVLVSINYRLGALGFLHSATNDELMPANNGLHDQLIAFEWLTHYLPGFGGDPDNITAVGQSAGGMSLAIHNLSGKVELPWKRSIQLSGSLVTMPSTSPSDYEDTVLEKAKQLGIKTTGRRNEEVIQDMIEMPIDKVRDLAFVGLPCAPSKLLPYDQPSMKLMRKRAPTATNVASQIVGSCTYDGGISYNLMLGDPKRKNHANTFIEIARSVLRYPEELLELYDIKADEEDKSALRSICQLESDIGFFAAALAQAQGFPGKTYLLLFDLGNPFDGPLPRGDCATHTWDIVSLLGAFESRVDAEYRDVIADLRDRILTYAVDGQAPWKAWEPEVGCALLVGAEGVRMVGEEEYMGPECRRGRLLALAEKERGEDGCDVLWDEVCRRFLMKGQ